MYYLFEAEILPGLEEISLEEIKKRLGHLSGFSLLAVEKGKVSFRLSKLEDALSYLRTVVAVYLLQEYAIPRPKAFLGDENFKKLCHQIRTVVLKREEFHSFRFSAAGKDSSIFTILKQQLADRFGFDYNQEAGDLVIRFRKNSKSWQVLIRLTSRPLSARVWRIENMPGALNATIASAMILLSKPRREDQFLNVMSGTGTLLIERALFGRAKKIVGIEKNFKVAQQSLVNIEAANLGDSIEVFSADFRDDLKLSTTFNIICADLPWGERVGRRSDLIMLYRDFLEFCTRVSSSKAKLMLLTQDYKTFIEQLGKGNQNWSLLTSYKIFQKGYNPKILVFEKSS